MHLRYKITETLLGSHGRSFRISPGNVRAAPPGGGLTMTSYPVGNKTSLSRKPYIADKKLLYISLSGCYGRSLRTLHEKVRAAPPGGEITMTSYPVGN